MAHAQRITALDNERIDLPARRTAVVLNANAKRVTPRVRREIEAAAPYADVFFTESLEQARFVSRRIVDSRYRTVVTGGGDGTVANTINQLLDAAETAGSAHRPRIGVLRLGTGNAIADHLGARTYKRDLEDLEDAPTRPVYLLRTSEGVRATFAGFGWDAHILNNYENLKKASERFAITRALFKSVLGYLIAGIGKSVPELVLQRPRWNVRVTNTGGLGFRLDSKGNVIERYAPGAVVYEGSVRMACLGTTPYYGFKFNVMPFAAKTPGMMHLRLLDLHPITAVRKLRSAWRGTLSDSKVTDLQLSACRLEFDGQVPFQLAGDAAGTRQSLEVSVADSPIECVHFN